MEKFLLRDKKIALLLIDVQEKLAPAISNIEQMKKPISVLLEVAKVFDMPIYLTEQYPHGLGNTLNFIMQELADTSVLIREKTEFNALLPDILADLEEKQIETVLIAGMETHICVYQTVRALRMQGFDVMVAEDAVGSRTAANQQNGLNLIKSLEAVISNSETIAFDLLKDAKHPCFKKISKLVK